MITPAPDTPHAAPKRARDDEADSETLISNDVIAHTSRWAADHKRLRTQRFDNATLRLLQQLEQHVETCLAGRERKDQLERIESKCIASAHPLTFPTAERRSVSPYYSSAGSPAQTTTVCKDTPCLAPSVWPIFSTPQTSEKSDVRGKDVFELDRHTVAAAQLELPIITI